jgi:hypothetical protein
VSARSFRALLCCLSLRVRARSAEYNRSGGTPNSGLAHHCMATFMAAGVIS